MDRAKQLESFLLYLQSKKDYVIVGSLSRYLQGEVENYRDIDIVTTNASQLFPEFISKSLFKEYGNKDRRVTYIINDFLIDVFERKELPQYNIIKDIPCDTMEEYTKNKKNYKVKKK